MLVPQQLQENLREGRVVPFVGAGVSMSVLDRDHKPAFPSWRELLVAAADRLDNEAKNKDANLVRSLLDVNPPDFLEAAKRARQSLGAVWYSFLKEQFDIDFSTIDSESLELARHIWRLGSKLVITTNYDEVLRWACPNQEDCQSWNIEAPVEQAFLLQQRLNRPIIWHLHGTILNAAELILCPDGYQLLYPEVNGNSARVKYEAALQTLRLQMASKSLLFIGFSLDDEYLGLQLSTVREVYKDAVGPHYAIVREDHAEKVRSLKIEPITITDFGNSLFSLMADLETAAPSKSVSSFIAERSARPASIPDYGPHRPVFYVPFKQKGDEIVGQQQVIEDVRRQLTQGKRTAIGQTAAFRGLGGLGKTQLAIEYAYRYRDEYPNGVIWINADQNIDAQLIEIAERARWIAPESDHKYKIQIAQQRLRSYSDCLIIFDNLDDRKAIDPYLPEPDANPHILVTSRTDHVDFQPVPLGLLDEHLSRELLVREARREPLGNDEEKAVWGIVELLGGLPLALELAGAYLGHRHTLSFQQYYQLLARDLKSALPKTVSSFTKHEADLYGTLRLSEDLLEEEHSLRDVLDLLTWSGSAPMSVNLISRLLGIRESKTLAGAFALGAELRLLQESKNTDSYSVHRLVAEVRRAEIPLGGRREWLNTTCSRLGDWFQEKREDFSQLTRCESEIDHLKRWQENATQFAPAHASRLMWLQGYPAYHRGRYFEARACLLEAQNILHGLNDIDQELRANLLNDLANINENLGDLQSVLDNHLEALRIRRELFGDSHPDIATSLDNLGGAYADQGDLRRALDCRKEALEMRRHLLGDLHASIATSLNNVGYCYAHKGDLALALEYFKSALEMRRRLSPTIDPDIANCLSNIGSCHTEQGNNKPALEYSQAALEMRRQLFGEIHPEVATSLCNVAACYTGPGELDQAFEYVQRALTMFRHLFGERHPDIAFSIAALSRLYRLQGNFEKALEHSQNALDMIRELVGERHPTTPQIARQVALTLAALNRRREAYDLVSHFLKNSNQGLAVEGLKRIETQLLKTTIRPGFRQHQKLGKGKKKKKRR